MSMSDHFKLGEFYYPVLYKLEWHQSVHGMDVKFFNPKDFNGILTNDPESVNASKEFLAQCGGRVVEDSRVTKDSFNPSRLVSRFLAQLIYDEDRAAFVRCVKGMLPTLFSKIEELILNEETNIELATKLQFINCVYLTIGDTNFRELKEYTTQKIHELFSFDPLWIELLVPRNWKNDWYLGEVNNYAFGFIGDIFELSPPNYTDWLSIQYLVLTEAQQPELIGLVAQALLSKAAVLQSAAEFIINLRRVFNHIEKNRKVSGLSEFALLARFSKYHLNMSFRKACENDGNVNEGWFDSLALEGNCNKLAATLFVKTESGLCLMFQITSRYCIRSEIETEVYETILTGSE